MNEIQIIYLQHIIKIWNISTNSRSNSYSPSHHITTKELDKIKESPCKPIKVTNMTIDTMEPMEPETQMSVVDAGVPNSMIPKKKGGAKAATKKAGPKSKTLMTGGRSLKPSPVAASSQSSNPNTIVSSGHKTTPAKKVVKKTKSDNLNHPTWGEMICAAISTLKDRTGSSRQAIVKYIKANYQVGDDAKYINKHIKMALRKITNDGKIKQSKGTGASGSFKLGENVKPVKSSDKKPKTLSTTPAKSSNTKRIKKPKMSGTPKKPVAKTAVKTATATTIKPKMTGAEKKKSILKKSKSPAATKKVTATTIKPVETKKTGKKTHGTKSPKKMIKGSK
ncbi:unnamed protein product [Gordionus sp. m RMFG-2023]